MIYLCAYPLPSPLCSSFSETRHGGHVRKRYCRASAVVQRSFAQDDGLWGVGDVCFCRRVARDSLGNHGSKEIRMAFHLCHPLLIRRRCKYDCVGFPPLHRWLCSPVYFYFPNTACTPSTRSLLSHPPLVLFWAQTNPSRVSFLLFPFSFLSTFSSFADFHSSDSRWAYNDISARTRGHARTQACLVIFKFLRMPTATTAVDVQDSQSESESENNSRTADGNNSRELLISGDTYRSSDAMLSQQEERMLETSAVQTIVSWTVCNHSRL